jgi:ferredoxin--NADP+ reductase
MNSSRRISDTRHPDKCDYNATVTLFRRVHEELLILRVLPDGGPIAFVPGQYTVLGLVAGDRPVAGGQEEFLTEDARLIFRAYSFGASMLDEAGRLLPPNQQPEHEFYISLVRTRNAHPLGLTPRLFALDVGSRLYVGRHAKGHYTIGTVSPDDAVVFAATGTGEAPHNAMIAHLLASRHRGPIVAVTCARYRRDLAYLAAHESLQRQFRNYQYVPLTTREAENVDSSLANYVGKRYLQEYFASGDFERETSVMLRPERMHVFLCGNPQMIELPRRTGNSGDRLPSPTGMVEVLERRGFRIDQPTTPGNVHFEKYW